MTTDSAAPAAPEWVVHDPLDSELDPTAWFPVERPRPDGSVHRSIDPNATLTVADGTVHLRVPSFSLRDDEVQVFDNPKYLTVTADRFELSTAGPTRFACDLAVENIGGDPADVRSAMAAFVIVDPDETGAVFDICGTSTRVFAIHEQLPLAPDQVEFTHAVESPFADFDDDISRPRECVISFDAARGEVIYEVDGQRIYFLRGVELPGAVRMGFGMFALLPIRDGASQSIRGQGLAARWGRFRTSGAKRIHS